MSHVGRQPRLKVPTNPPNLFNINWTEISPFKYTQLYKTQTLQRSIFYAIMSVPYLLSSQAGHIPASQKIPVIAKPFVSEKAEKALDLVSAMTISAVHSHMLTDPHRSIDLSRKNAYLPKRFSRSSLAKARPIGSTHTHQSSKI